MKWERLGQLWLCQTNEIKITKIGLANYFYEKKQTKWLHLPLTKSLSKELSCVVTVVAAREDPSADITAQTI